MANERGQQVSMKRYGGTLAGLLVGAIGGFEPGSARALCSDHSGVAGAGRRTGNKDRNIKVDLSYSRTTLKGGGQAIDRSAPVIVTRKPECVLFTRLQLAF